MAKQIKLSQGKFALVDDDDYEFLSQYKWHAQKANNGKWYACRNIENDGVKTLQMLHSLLVMPIDGFEIDHINRNSLDNHRSNLRLVTHEQNMWNCSKRKNNTSGYIGVYWDKHANKWRANIKIHGREVQLGCFLSPIDAAKAYDKVARKLRGEFAVTNFPT